MEVNGLRWQEGTRQPLPGEVPRKQRELQLNAGERLIHHPVSVDVGELGGLQEGHIDAGEPRSVEQEILEDHKLWWRLAS